VKIRTVLGTIAICACFLPVGAQADGLVDEVKLGIMDHDVPIGAHHVENGADVNGELLFTSPDFLSFLWSPRPHLGISVNTAGKNSYAYWGLTWTGDFYKDAFTPGDGFFAALGLGGAVHNGPDVSYEPDRKGLGTRFLFHESVETGYHTAARISFSIFLDHISNANTASHNPGITNLGVRVGYGF
jgi:lipid A 3-O-deacylase